MIRRILTYLLSSGITILVDFAVFSAASYVGAGVFAATALGRTFAAVVNFTINRKAVFRSDGNVYAQFLKYILLVCASGAASAYSISELQKHIAVNVVVIKAFVEGILFFFNYAVQRWLIFPNKHAEKMNN